MAGIDFGAVAGTMGGTLLALVAAGRWLKRRRRFAASFSTAAMGFTAIGLEMLLLLGFQAVYGYVYRQLAVLLAAFMAGMALGSWLGMRPTARGGMRVLAITQALAAFAPLVLLGLFQAIGRANGAASLAASQIAFPALALVSGMLGGYEFPVASRIFFEGKDAAERPSALYALDLAGSCVGAVLFSAWFVPVFGFFRTAWLSAMVSLAPAATALLAGSERDPEE
jgi:predicted membrane-bound spermidine synthase